MNRSHPQQDHVSLGLAQLHDMGLHILILELHGHFGHQLHAMGNHLFAGSGQAVFAVVVVQVGDGHPLEAHFFDPESNQGLGFDII